MSLTRQCAEAQALRFDGLVAAIETFKILQRQGLAIRSSSDEESNLMQFLSGKADYCPGLKHMLKDRKFLSHHVIAELQMLIQLEAQRSLIEEIKKNSYFSVICDKSTDI